MRKTNKVRENLHLMVPREHNQNIESWYSANIVLFIYTNHKYTYVSLRQYNPEGQQKTKYRKIRKITPHINVSLLNFQQISLSEKIWFLCRLPKIFGWNAFSSTLSRWNFDSVDKCTKVSFFVFMFPSVLVLLCPVCLLKWKVKIYLNSFLFIWHTFCLYQPIFTVKYFEAPTHVSFQFAHGVFAESLLVTVHGGCL